MGGQRYFLQDVKDWGDKTRQQAAHFQAGWKAGLSDVPKQSGQLPKETRGGVMMLCPCGGLVDVADLTRNRTRYWCRACGRYEIFPPKGVDTQSQAEMDLTASSSYDAPQILSQGK